MDCHGEQQRWRVKIIAIFGTLGLLSAAFGFAAEATKLQLDEVRDVNGGGCIRYPNRTSATAFGVAAIVALLVFRVYCHGIQSPSPMLQDSRFLSWVAWFGAMCFYVAGLLMIENQGQELRYRDYKSYYVCKIVKPGIFGAGASFALTSIVLEIIYLAAADHVKKATTIPSTQLSVSH